MEKTVLKNTSKCFKKKMLPQNLHTKEVWINQILQTNLPAITLEHLKKATEREPELCKPNSQGKERARN